MIDESIHEDPKTPPHLNRATALSLLDQASTSDFPVLKAFQEYIEAEQVRSRKRMFGLSIFFAILLVVVFVAFSVIMITVINRDQHNMSVVTARNQELSDKLLDIALRERAMPQTSAHPPATSQVQDAALKPLIDKIEHLATALSLKERQAQPSTATTVPPVAPAPNDVSEVARLREEVRRQKEEALESVRVVREKMERVLKQEREKLCREQVQIAAQPVDLKTAKPICYFDDPEEKPAPAAPAAAPKPESPKPDSKKPAELKTKTLDVTVSSQEGEAIPFLIELPENK